MHEWDLEVVDSAIFIIGKNRVKGPSDDFDWHIEKRSAVTGELIEDFGVSGVVRHNPTEGYEQPEAITADASSIYVVGNGNDADGDGWRIEKRDRRTGDLVQGFGGTGVVISALSPTYGSAEGVLADASYLYIFGERATEGESQSEWRLEKRSKVTGQPVFDFGLGGAITLEHRYWRPARVIDIAIDGDDLFVLREDLGVESSKWRVEKRLARTGGA